MCECVLDSIHPFFFFFFSFTESRCIMAGLSFLLETMYESDVAMIVHYQPKVLMHDSSHSLLLFICIAF